EDAPVYEEKAGRVTVPLHFDPAGSVFVVFRRPGRGAPHLASVTHVGAAPPARPAPRIEVRKAFYEPASGRGGADVTGKGAGMGAAGQYAIPATNEAFGDPTPNVPKRLRVEYLLDGKPAQKVVAENETLELAETGAGATLPAFEVARRPDAGVQLRPWEAGTYE